MEIEGIRVNYAVERALDKSYFASDAATMIQRYTRGFLVRNIKFRAQKKAAMIVIQSHVRCYLAKCELDRRLFARS
jgi:hypothetical protein